MVVQPIGIVVGPGDLAPGLALPTGQAVRVASGETLSFVVSLLHSDGTPWAPDGGTAEVRIYDTPGWGRTPRLTVALAYRREDGLWAGTVPAATTARWAPGCQMSWSLWTDHDGDQNQVIPLSLLTVVR